MANHGLTSAVQPTQAALVRIGELARELGVSADTLRFYERAGILPRPRRAENGYRDYAPAELERTRLMLELRRLDIPLADAARIAGWCQTGHCEQTSVALPQLLAARRAAIRERIGRLEELDRRLAALESHLALAALPMVGDAGPCCAAAAVVRADPQAAVHPQPAAGSTAASAGA